MIIRICFIFVLCLFLSSCSYQGGGTIGTGMPLSSGRNKAINTGVSYVNLTGRVVSALGKPIENAEVTIVTDRSQETVTSDFDGRFILTLVTKVGESVKVSVNNGRATFSDTFLVDQENISHGLVTITLQGNGRIKVSDLRWYQ